MTCISLLRCGPCRAIAPLFKELSTSHKDSIVFVKVDVDDAPEVAASMGIRSVPSFFRFDENGKEVSSFSGANPKALEEAIEAALGK